MGVAERLLPLSKGRRVKKGQKKYVPFHIAAEKVAKQLKGLEEKYSKATIARGIEDYLFISASDEEKAIFDNGEKKVEKV